MYITCLDAAQWTKHGSSSNWSNQLQDLAEFVGFKTRVSHEFVEDPYIQNYFEYESNRGKPIIKGRLKSALPYWRDEIKAPPSVLNIIEDGVKLNFITEPPKFSLKNNKSAHANADFVTTAVKELLNYNLIMEVKNQPAAVSPLSVACNGDKKRLILDLSVLNEYIHYERIKLEDQNDFFEMAKFCNYVATFDIKSCYHQIMVNKEHVKYLGFKWFVNGKERFFVFLVVPFGLCCGPRICKKLFRPLVTRWRLLSIVNILFYDDGIFGGVTFKDTSNASTLIFNDMMKCHILPNAEKSNWQPRKLAEWLGYEWNFNDFSVKVSERRENNFMIRLKDLKSTLPIVTPRKVAFVVGSLISMFLVLQEKCLLYSRYMQNIINFRAWEDRGWDEEININCVDFGHNVIEEIEFLETNFVKLNSRSFKPILKPHKVMFGDAGEYGIGGVLCDGSESIKFCASLPDTLIGMIFSHLQIRQITL